MKLYLAGPMRGIPHFNFPAFHAAAKKLRDQGHVVFSPAEKDVEVYGSQLADGNLTGDEQKAAKEHGFSLRKALAIDLDYICREADGIALLPNWSNSKGAKAEKAAAEALGLSVFYVQGNGELSHAEAQ